MNDNINNEQNRLKFFPITMFATTMGMGGLTIMYQKSAEVLQIPHTIGDTLLILVTAMFLIITSIYLVKFIKYPQVVKKEWNHAIRINFFAAFSISMLILSIIYKEQYENISLFFWIFGTVVHFLLTLHTIKFWINSNQELDHSNPAWFIPIVGNVLVPVGGVGFVPTGLLMYFFSLGVFFWIILFAILLNRIIFHHQLPGKFMPTLFIFIAPPAIAFIAYFKMFGVIDDAFALILYNLALFFTILVTFMYKNFIKIKFFISWWAFTFPLAAITIATLLMYSKTQDKMLMYGSYLLVFITSAVFVIVIYQTIKNMLIHEVCIQE